MKEYKFKAELQPGEGGGVYIPFPYDVKKEFGKGRVPIQCTIDGHPYRGTMVKYGTPYHIIIVLKAIREKINKKAGDKVSVWLVEDKEKRKMEVPADLRKELKKHKLETFFEKMSFTHQKEYINHINDAKKEETRKSRIGKTIEMLSKKGK